MAQKDTKNLITCVKCQATNQLGRIFCATCGARLELQDITSNIAAKRVWVPAVSGLAGKVIGIIILMLIFQAVMAFIPQTIPIGVAGSSAGLGAVSGFARAGENLLRGRTIGRRFSEAEINGFFLDEKARQMNVESFSVDVTEGVVRVRMIRKLTRFDVGPWLIHPTLSYEAVFVPNGNRLRFRSARHGLLPLIGPMKYAVGRMMLGRLSSLPESALTKYVSKIVATDESVEITLQN